MVKYTLEELILRLENRKKYQFEILKKQTLEIYENIKPINLIKNTLHEIVAPSRENQLNILQNIVGVATAFIYKKIFMGNSKKSN